MNLNSQIALLLTLTILSPAGAKETGGPRQLSFKDLPQLIREKNENVQASESLALAAKKRTGFLVRSFLPEVSLKTGNQSAKLGSANEENKNHWSAQAQLNLYRGGRDNLEEKIRQSKLEFSKASITQEYESELRAARKTYWQIVANDKILKELSLALKDNKENILSAKRRSGAGVATNADAVHFELENTLLNQQVKKLTIEQDNLKNQLAVMLSLDEHKNLVLSEDFTHPPDNIVQPLLADFNTPETELLKQEKAIHDHKRKQASRWWVPSVDLYAVYQRPTILENDQRALAEENEWATGIMLSMNLGESFEQHANKKAEELEAQAVSQKLSYAQKNANAVYHDLNHNLTLLHELIHDADNDVEKSASFLKLTKSEYSRGVKNGPDLQEAFSKYYDFKTRRIELYRLYYEAEADLAYQTALKKNQ